MDFRVDQEFKALIPPLSPEEKEQLEKNILAEGCRDALVVWRGVPGLNGETADILLDGHNRLDICQKHGITFKTIGVDLPSREAASDWIDKNQLGRRNLTPDAFKLLLGRRYNRVKKAQGAPAGNQNAAPKQTAQNEPVVSTAARLATEHCVSPATWATWRGVGRYFRGVWGLSYLDSRSVMASSRRSLIRQPSVAARILSRRRRSSSREVLKVFRFGLSISPLLIGGAC